MPLIIPANSAVGGGYDVDNSLRYDKNSSQYLRRTCGSSASSYTLSLWVKNCEPQGGDTTAIYWNGAGAKINWEFNGSSQIYWYDPETRTTASYRDVSAWYHLVWKVSSNVGTLYVNGLAASGLTSVSGIDSLNSGNFIYLGSDAGQYSPQNGYFSEVCFIDGTALDPTSFGEYDEDSGIWKPIDVSGLTFGTNGFYLDFEDSSALGNDVSGNNNDLTVNNLTAINQSTDTCTTNFCTANPLHFGAASHPGASNLSDGNLTFTSTQAGSPYPYYFSTFAASQGKWYAEFKVTTGNSAVIGIGTGVGSGFLGAGLYDYSYYYDGTFYNYGSNQGSQSSYTDGDIISVALDLDNNKIYVAKNNTWQHSGNPSGNSGGYTITAPASNGTGVYHIAYGDAGGGTPAIQGNFGSPPYAISSGNADGDGYGNFEYAVPSGYYALNTKNLAEYG